MNSVLSLMGPIRGITEKCHLCKRKPKECLGWSFRIDPDPEPDITEPDDKVLRIFCPSCTEKRVDRSSLVSRSRPCPKPRTKKTLCKAPNRPVSSPKERLEPVDVSTQESTERLSEPQKPKRSRRRQRKPQRWKRQQKKDLLDYIHLSQDLLNTVELAELVGIDVKVASAICHNLEKSGLIERVKPRKGRIKWRLR